MDNNVLKKKDLKELEQLVELAKEQNNEINMNLVYMTINIDSDNYDAIMNYFSAHGITLIQEDVEPEVTAYLCEGEKIRPFDPSKIDITMKPLTLDALIKRIKNEEVEFDTSFQRKSGLWSKEQKSRLIESIFLRIPLPAFYFDASDEDKWVIIDGLQRVTALKEFVVDKSLKLCNLEFFPELNGCGYNKLPRTFQRRIDETVINVYLVNPSTPDNVKFNIFKRINTGGLALTPQEIRNALYQGRATKFLLECASMGSFIQATCGSVKSERMMDREFVLRFVAFCYLNLDKYSGNNIDDFLNEGMVYLNHLSDDTLEEIRKTFDFVMKSISKIMGRDAFRKVCSDGRRRPINKVIFESWCFVIRQKSNEEIDILVKNKAVVKREFTNLCENPSYLYLLKSPDRKSLNMRIKYVENLVNSILGAKIENQK